MKRTKLDTLITLTAMGTLCLPAAYAAEATGSNMKDTYDSIWGAATLYSDKENSFVQKLSFTGRLQYDYVNFRDEDAPRMDDTTWRRARAGFKATVLNDFTAHIEANFDLEDTNPVYDGLTDAYIAYKAEQGWTLKVGKQGVGFTLEGATSSKSLITTERRHLAENFWFTREYFIGASVEGGDDVWSYTVGVFSNDASDEFENFADEKYFLLLSVGRDVSELFEGAEAAVRMDVVYNRESDRLGTKSLESVVSVNGQYSKGDFHLDGDLTWAKSFSGNKLWGLQVMPYYDLSKMFQIAAAYTYLSSDDANGLSNGRYERRAVSGRGDELHDFYLGLNTYFYGHKLKWQNGLQYTDMKDSAGLSDGFKGVGFTSAIRISW